MKRKLLLFVFTLSLLTWAQQPYVYRILQPVGGASATGNTGFINTQGTGATYASLSWTINGSLATCTIQVDFSNDGSTVAGQLIGAQTCTSNGSIIAGSTSTPSYVRVSYVIGTGGGYLNLVGQGCTNATCTTGGGGGGSGTVSANNGSANVIAKYNAAGGSTTVNPDALLSDSGTVLNYTGTGGIAASGPVASGSDGTHPSYITFIGNTTQPAVPANTVGWMGPTTTTFTGYSCQFPSTAPSGGQVLSCGTPASGISTGTWTTVGGGAFPLTITGGVSGGIPCFTSTTVEAASGILNSNLLVKGSGAGVCPTNSLFTDDGTTATYTGTGGTKAPVFTSTGATAGFIDFPQGTTSAAVAPCNVATSICEQAPTAVTSYLVNKPGAAFSGVLVGINAANVITQKYSGDTAHYSSGAVTLGSATSITSTALCSTIDCPAGNYQVSLYIDVTTACTTTGSYIVNLIYTDDTTVSKTVFFNVEGTGVTFATGSLALASTTNFASGVMFIHSTGAVGINYSTTAGACGTGGPAVGKFYLTVVPLS